MASKRKPSGLKSIDQRPYGNNEVAWHQIVSRSSECNALGGVSKKSQAVHQNAKPVAGKALRSSVRGNTTRANKCM